MKDPLYTRWCYPHAAPPHSFIASTNEGFARLDSAESLLSEVANSPVTFEDAQNRYVTVQINLETWEMVKTYLLKNRIK